MEFAGNKKGVWKIQIMSVGKSRQCDLSNQSWSSVFEKPPRIWHSHSSSKANFCENQLWKSFSMGALKIGLNRIKTWLKAKTGKKKSVRAKAGERRNSSFHFNPWARQSNLIFSVISAAPNASWELCRLCSVLVSMPREINHRPEAAGVTHISPLLPLAWHQAAGAPPQSREQWSSHAFCKILAGTHLMRCTVISIFYSALCHWTQHREVLGFFFLCTFSQEFTANYFTHGWGGCTGTRHLPILLPLEKHFTHDYLLSDSLSGLITITPSQQQYKNTRRVSRARCVYCSTASWAVHVQDTESDTGCLFWHGSLW